MLEQANKNNDKSIGYFLKKNGFQKIKICRNRLGHRLVTIILNGKKARFIIDTGATNSVLDRERAKKFSLIYKIDAVKAGGLGADGLEVSKSTDNNIRIGGI